MEDVTKTGPVGLKGLKGINTKKTVAEQYIENFNKKYKGQETLDPNTVNISYKQAAAEYYQDTLDSFGYGNSKYDEDMTEAQLYNIEDTRALKQPWYDNIGNGIAKFAGKVGSTVIGTIAGIPVGIGTAILDQRWSGLWDNAVTQGLQQFDDYMESSFTNYQTEKQKNAKWWELDNLTSAKFLVDDVFVNAGFTVGAIASGNIVGGTMGAALALTKSANIAKYGQKAVALISSLTSATSEGSIEAMQAKKEYLQRGEEDLKISYSSALQELQNKYADKIGKTLVRSKDGRYSYDPAYESYKLELNKLKDDYNKSRDALEEEAQKVGNRVLLGNQALLSFGNMVQFGKSFSKSYENALKYERMSNKALGKDLIKNTGTSLQDATENIGKAITGNNGKVTSDIIKNSGIKVEAVEPAGGKIWAATKGLLTEGSEEMNQQFITSASESYYENRYKSIDGYWRDRLGVYGKKEAGALIDQFGQAIADGFGKSWGDINQWEQFLIGGLMGVSGVYAPTKLFNQDKSKKWYDPRRYGSYEGGAINEIIDYNKKKAAAEGNVQKLNELLSTEKFWNHWYKERENLATTLAIQNSQDEALQEENKKAFKDKEDDYFAHIVNTFMRAGKINDLRAIYNSHRDLSDEEIDNIVKSSTRKVDQGSIEKELEPLQEKLNNINQTISDLYESEKEITAKGGNTEGIKKQLEDLNYAASILQDDMNKVKTKYSEAKSNYIGTYVDSNGNRTKTNDQIRQELNDLSDNVNSKIDSYLEAAERVQVDTKGDLSDEQEDVLTYLAYKNKESLKRASDIFDKNPLIPSNYTISGITVGDKRLTSLEEIKSALNLEDGAITDNNNGTFTIKTSGMSDSRRQSLFDITVSDQENTDILNKEISNIAEKKGLTTDEVNKAINDINDHFKLKSDAMEYYNTLMTYLFSPSTINKDKEEVKNEEEKAQRKKDIEETLGNNNVSEVFKRMYEGDLPSDININDIDSDLQETYKEARKLYKKYKNLEEAINRSDATEAEKRIMMHLLNSKAETAQYASDLVGITEKDINSTNKDELLEISGYESVEDLKKAMNIAENEGNETSDIENIKGQALDKLNKIFSDEDENEKKLSKEPKSRTSEQKDKDKKIENSKSNTVGKDGGTKTSSSNSNIIVNLGKVNSNSKTYNIRAVKTIMSSNTYDIKIQYEKNGEWIDGYFPATLDIILSKVNNIKKIEEKLDKNGRAHTYLSLKIGNSDTLDFKLEDSNIVPISKIEVRNINGKTSVSVLLHKRSKTKYETSNNKVFRNPKLFIKNESDIDTILGSPKGSLGPVSHNRASVNVIKVRGNKEDEKNLIDQEREENNTLGNPKNKNVIKPQTTKFYIHPIDKNGKIKYVPYYETLKDDNPLKEIYEKLYKWLTSKNLFSNQDKMQIGDKIHFAFSSSLNNTLEMEDSPILLMLDSNNNIVGDLANPSLNPKIIEDNPSLKELYEYALDQYKNGKGNKEGDFTIITDIDNNPITTSVSNKYIGTPHFGTENKPATDVLVTRNSDGTEKYDFEIGVAVSNKMGDIRIETANSGEINSPIKAKEGQPYVLIHTSDNNNPWYPIPILMNTADSIDKDSIFYHALIYSLSGINEIKDNNDLIRYKSKIENLLYFPDNTLYIDKNGDTIEIKINNKVVYSYNPKSNTLQGENLGEEVLRNITENYTIPVNINRGLFNTNIEYVRDGKIEEAPYKEVIGGLIFTNAVSNRTVNDFFDVDLISIKDGKVTTKKAERMKPSDVIITKDPNRYTNKNKKRLDTGYFYYRENGEDIIEDDKGNKLQISDNNNEEENLKIAYSLILATQENDIGLFTLPSFGGKTLVVEKNNGKIQYKWGPSPVSNNNDVNTKIDIFISDQKKVKREETDSKHYIINGERYVRLHTKIDEVFGESIKLEEDQKNEINKVLATIEEFITSFKDQDDDYSYKDAALKLVENQLENDESNTLYQKIREDLKNLSDRATLQQIMDTIRVRYMEVVTGFKSVRALNTGNTIDSIVRDFFKNPDKDTSYDSLNPIYKKILSENAYNNLLKYLKTIYNRYKDTYTFIADNLVVGTNINGENVAGELDLLVVNKKTGEIEIWDIKTSSRNFVNEDNSLSDSFTKIGNKFTRSSKEQYTIQLNSYRDMILNKYGLKSVKLRILPIRITYDKTEEDTVSNMSGQSIIDLDIIPNVLSNKNKVKETIENSKTVKDNQKLDNENNTEVKEWNESEFIKILENKKVKVNTIEKIVNSINEKTEQDKNLIMSFIDSMTFLAKDSRHIIPSINKRLTQEKNKVSKDTSSKKLTQRSDDIKSIPNNIPNKNDPNLDNISVEDIRYGTKESNSVDKACD